MTDDDLDRLTRLLGQCLNRIDDQAARLISGATGDDPEVLERLDAEAARLQQLVASIAAHAAGGAEQGADLDRAVNQAVRQILEEVGFPLVVREHLAGDLPPTDCRPSQVQQAVFRGLMLAVDHAGSGGEIAVATRAEAEDVVFELRCHGRGDAHLGQRAVTLQEFVIALHGRCDWTVDRGGDLRLTIELPAMAESGGHQD